MTEEIRRAFHEELDDLCRDVARLGALAGEAIEAGTNALLDADLPSVESVVTGDAVLDELTHSIEDRVLSLLARQQPMAVDLRVLVTILRAIHELERVGDLMVRVAKATRRLYPAQIDPKVRGLIDRMREQAAVQLRLAVDAFAARDPALGAALPDMDDVMDELQRDLFQAVFRLGASDEAELRRAVQIALLGRYLERIGDHALNIAERVEFMVSGRRQTTVSR